MIYKLNKSFHILIILFFISSYSFAQQDSSVISTDSTITNVNSIHADSNIEEDTIVNQTVFGNKNDSIVKWKNSPEFAYMAYLDSLLNKNKDLRQDTIDVESSNSLAKNKSTSKSTDNSGINNFLNSFPLKIFFWIMAVFFIGFILHKLFFKSGLFAKEIVNSDDETSNEEPEKLNEFSQYNVLINEAETKNDFNLATRYLYLQTLKRLSEKELILFSPDKTNNVYIQELYETNYQHKFESLTRNYEYIWYGKFVIDNNSYLQLKGQFILFNKQI
jgi:hypothetical protein